MNPSASGRQFLRTLGLVALAIASWEFGVDSREWVDERLPIKARPRRSI